MSKSRQHLIYQLIYLINTLPLFWPLDIDSLKLKCTGGPYVQVIFKTVPLQTYFATSHHITHNMLVRILAFGAQSCFIYNCVVHFCYLLNMNEIQALYSLGYIPFKQSSRVTYHVSSARIRICSCLNI